MWGRDVVEASLSSSSALQPHLLLSTDERWLHFIGIKHSGVQTILVSEPVLQRILPAQSTKQHEAIALIRTELDKWQQADGRSLYLDGVGDPGNVGTLIRSAHAFGWKRVILGPESAHAFNPKTVRSSMGSIFHVPIHEASHEETRKLLHGSARNGGRLTVLGADMTGLPVESLMPQLRTRDVLLAVGHEGQGLSRTMRQLCDKFITVPMQPGLDSLNVAVAASVLMYEASKAP